MPPGPSATSSPRRALLALLGVLVLGAGFGAWLGLRRHGPPRPDIVLLVWDTARADRTSTCGYASRTTPRLEMLAAGGVNFRWCITPSPWTPPSHASIFTGLLPSRHGLQERMGDKVHPELPLLAATLREAGYETVACSANPLLAATGLLRGFETVLPAGGDPVKASGEDIVRRIDRWLGGRPLGGAERRPLFLFVNLMDAHLPLRPSGADLRAVHSAEDAARVPPAGIALDELGALAHNLGVRRLTHEEVRILSLAYDGGMHAADRATGEILDLLGREGIFEKAVVAVVGDHGESLGEQGDLEHRMSVHDAVIRVPLVVRWPGRLEGGRVEDAQVRAQDLYPTLLEAAGLAVPLGCGADATTLAESPLRPRESVTQLLWIHSYLPGVRDRFKGAPESAFDRFFLSRLAVREAAVGPTARKWVLVRRFVPPDGSRDERESLYDTRTDAAEERDLLGPGASPGDRAAAAAIRARHEALTR